MNSVNDVLGMVATEAVEGPFEGNPDLGPEEKRLPQTIGPEMRRWYWVFFEELNHQQEENPKIIVQWLGRHVLHLGNGLYYRDRWLVFSLYTGENTPIDGIAFRISSEVTPKQLVMVRDQAIWRAADLTIQMVENNLKIE